MSEENSTIDDIFEGLCRTLSLDGEVGATSAKFSALNTNAERVFFAENILKKYSLFPKLHQEPKNDDQSTKYRQEGNEAFKKKNGFAAWSLYTKSIACAKNNSECLALAYANRSAVLYEKQLYKQCLEDITNAFKNNYPKHLHEKLIQREEKARELLSNYKTLKYYDKVHNVEETNNNIKCASTSVEIRKSNDLGRHVVAVKKIKLGEVIAVEKPYAKVLLKEWLRDHCYSCLEVCYNLLPCDNCIYAMYCSKKCQQLAWNKFHKYECSILSALYKLDISKLILLALRIAISAKEHYNDINNYSLEDAVYNSGCYKEIHFLESNAHLRTNADLFPRAISAAIIRNLLKTNDFFHHDLDNNADEIFSELLLRHIQTGPTNFHEISEYAENDKGLFTSQEIGAGAYAFLSLLNHSCVPNVVRHCHGSEIILRALKPILQGEEVLDNYGYHHAVMGKTGRQRELRRQYFFSCKCEACENDWPLYNCLPQKGNLLSFLPNESLEALRHGDRKEAKVVLALLLDSYANKTQMRPNKSYANMQEIVKQCYALLGNRKPIF